MAVNLSYAAQSALNAQFIHILINLSSLISFATVHGFPMRILFIGQRGIPVLGSQAAIRREWRVQNLASALDALSHQVAVVCAPPFISRGIRQFGSIQLLHRPSFDPRYPGGLLHTLLSLIDVARFRPDVIHLHGWHGATFIRVMQWLQADSNLIWTIDSLPRPTWLVKLLLRQAVGAGATLITPSRVLQYQLLVTHGIRAEYIPDGFRDETIKPISLGHFGLRRGSYCLSLAREEADVRALASAFASSRLRKKLMVLADGNLSWAKRLQRRYSFLRFVMADSQRALRSLIEGASLVHISDENAVEELLWAMDAGKTILARAVPEIQAILGVTGRYYLPGKTQQLADMLRLALKHQDQIQAKQAQRRAKAHFAWERIAGEYLAAYRGPLGSPVSVDSLRRVSFVSASHEQGI